MKLEETRQFFSNDRYAKLTGIEILEVGDCYAKCSLDIDDRHMNARNFLMGGVPYTMADYTFAIATNDPGVKSTVTVTSQISHMNVTKGKKLFSECRCIKEGRSLCFYRVTITDDLGVLVAEINITGKHV